MRIAQAWLRGLREPGVESLRARDGAVIGLAQALALLPGVSRSGISLTAGLLLGPERAAAARYSFPLSVPAVVSSGLFELRDIGGEGATSAPATALATLLAIGTGYASIAFLLRFLTTHTTSAFVAYHVALGVLVMVLVGAGAIK